MDSELSFTNWSSVWSNQMQNSLFNESLNEWERDRSLINSNIICSNENISDINEECLQWLTHWESKQNTASDTTTSTDITFTSIPTMESTVFDDLFSSNISQISYEQSVIPVYKWPFLLLGILVFIGGFGNILVCLAIGFERRLQNATNYFLLRYSFDVCSLQQQFWFLTNQLDFIYSLAVADLLVSVVVMPFGILNEFYGQFYYWSKLSFNSFLYNRIWLQLMKEIEMKSFVLYLVQKLLLKYVFPFIKCFPFFYLPLNQKYMSNAFVVKVMILCRRFTFDLWLKTVFKWYFLKK